MVREQENTEASSDTNGRLISIFLFFFFSAEMDKGEEMRKKEPLTAVQR